MLSAFWISLASQTLAQGERVWWIAYTTLCSTLPEYSNDPGNDQ